MLAMARKRQRTGKKKLGPWATKLKALRELHGLTQKEAAEKADVALRTWIGWENDQADPGRITEKLLRQAFPDLK